MDLEERKRLAEAVKEWGLVYVVITSVDRDDLPDQGASHFADCIHEIKRQHPSIIVEVLIPDFRGSEDCLKTIIAAGPEVIAHNIETVSSLQRKVRDIRAGYEQSLGVLRAVKRLSPATYTKSSIMLGFGEKDDEVLQALRELRAAGVDIVTLGQYLRPSPRHIALQEYVHPEKFNYFRQIAEQLGFLYCAAGPFVRSSYRAGELFMKGIIRKEGTHGPQDTRDISG